MTTQKKDNLDFFFQKWNEVAEEINSLPTLNWSEADTRIKVVDKILFDVLGWDKNFSSFEERAGCGFTDYTLKESNCARLIVEAKKDCVSFDLSKRQSAKPYDLKGPAFNSASKDGINQAITYSAFKGAELACVTNGQEWIVFRSNRLGDGKDVLDGKAFIFKSIDDITDNFKVFYDLLSCESSKKLNFRGLFQSAEGIPVRDLAFFESPQDPDNKKLLDRGEFSADFDAIMSAFFERLKGDQDSEMIQKCFVVSPESDLAEEKLLRIASDISEKIKSLNPKTGEQLITLIEHVKLTSKNRFILLVGNKGAGKSTFIDRFFRFVLPAEHQTYLKLLRIDLSKNTGDKSNIISWLDRQLLEEAEQAVFDETNQQSGWDELVGKIFFSDYQRWSQRTMKGLYEKDKEQFKIQFGQHIEKIRSDQPNEYIKKLINYLTKSNQKIPCLIFDNTDHFSIDFQETVFQYARSLYESEFCVVLMPITDKTSWQLSKQGALQSFESEALFLPTPKPERIIERRINYLSEKLDDSAAKNSDRYFLSKGIRLKLDNIGAFVAGLNKIFLETPNVSQWIGGLVNNDIRRLLELTRDTIASPHLKLDDLLKASFASSAHAIPPYKIKNAIIKKRYNIYPQDEHSFVQNVYIPADEHPTTPLLSLRIMQYLRDATNKRSDQNDFISLEKIINYFLLMGIPALAVKSSVGQLLKHGLLLNFDPTVIDINDECRLELASCGRIHLYWGTADKDYLNIMKDVTPLRDKSACDIIRQSYQDYKNQWSHAITAFIDYLVSEDEIYCNIPDHPDFERQTSIIKGLQRLKGNLSINQATE